MPTLEKDAETNACFKQVLLRPHKCKSLQTCRGVKFTQDFSAPLCAQPGKADKVSAYSYEPNWRHYLAQQKVLAERADDKLRRSCMWPVLHDTSSLRQWWVSGSEQHRCVLDDFVSLFSGRLKHRTDSTLSGTWARWEASFFSATFSNNTLEEQHMQPSDFSKTYCPRRVWRMALPSDLVWLVLRFAGVVQRSDGMPIHIAGTEKEKCRLLDAAPASAEFHLVSPGHHDAQLSAAEFFALRHVETAARLEYMSEARGRPRPGQVHPDAEHEDDDGVVPSSAKRADSDIEFEDEEKLPGGAEDDEDAAADDLLDKTRDYKVRWPVQDTEMDDIVHRRAEALNLIGSKAIGAKKNLLKAFLQDHDKAYSTCLFNMQPDASIRVRRVTALLKPHSAQQLASAFAQQQLHAENRKLNKSSTAVSQVAAYVRAEMPVDAQSRELSAGDLPRSPLDYGEELIARSGVWRSEEQYLTCLFLLQPMQQIWDAAIQKGCVADVCSPHTLASLCREFGMRQILLHGPGGSGKTYSLTEVVIKVARFFFGADGILPVAASNSAARLLGGKTMHAAAKLTRKQSLATNRQLFKFVRLYLSLVDAHSHQDFVHHSCSYTRKIFFTCYRELWQALCCLVVSGGFAICAASAYPH